MYTQGKRNHLNTTQNTATHTKVIGEIRKATEILKEFVTGDGEVLYFKTEGKTFCLISCSDGSFDIHRARYEQGKFNLLPRAKKIKALRGVDNFVAQSR